MNLKELRGKKTLILLMIIGFLIILPGCGQKSKTEAVTAGAGKNLKTDKVRPRSEAFFGLHFDLHPNASDTELGADVSEENIAELLDRVKPDYVQYDCKGHPGYTGYPTKVGWPSPGIVKDSLAIWRKVTRERGVGLYIHYSGVWDSKAIEEHPDWARIDADGKRDPNATSVFGPYVDRLLIPQLKEVIAAYDLDGAWVDGECWRAELDYSPEALKAWQKYSGKDRAPKSPADPDWLEWKMFQRQAFESYLCHWVDALHEFRPGVQLTSNWMYTTFAPKPVVAHLDFLSGDYSPSLSVDRARVEARYLASTGKPWDLMAWGFDRGRDQGWSLKSAFHLQQEAAVVLMQGGGFQVYNTPTRRGYIVPAIIDQLEQVARFCRERQSLSFKSRTVPQVALLLSETSLWERMDRVFSPWAGEYDELEGALQALLELHFSVDILAEHQLISRIKEFPLLVIPEVHRLEPDFQKEVVSFVENGGSLLLLGEKSARLFEPLLGVKMVGEPQQITAELATPAGPVSLNGRWQEVELAGAEPIGFRYPTRDFRRGQAIAATIASYGKGKVAAVYGPLALAFFRSHHPALRQFIGNLTQKLFPSPAVIVEAPPTVDVALRRTADNRLTLHLLNRTGFPVPDRYNFIDYVPPVGPIQIKLALEEKPQKVLWMPEVTRLKWKWDKGYLYTTVPALHIHGILLVD
ncbi:MAG: hypothetical protein H5U05_06970 [Candidatus Aminicenantes bacterium]|nr:hypothetical protein [Candidatus Aminicenantes bacterium]